MSLIDPTAIIGEGARIGQGSSIGPYTVIGPAVVLGENNQVGPHVVIAGNTRIGNNNKISPFASIGGPPQDLSYRGEDTLLQIGDNNIIREYVTLQPGTVHGLRRTVVGNNNMFMACSHVAHDVVVGDNCIFANSAALAGHVQVGNRVILGGLSAVHQFVRLGNYCFLAGGSMVAKDVPPFCLVYGSPACLNGLNEVGLKRAGHAAETVVKLRKIYRQAFRFGAGFKIRVKELLDQHSDFELAEQLLAFVLADSKRGICMPSAGGAYNSCSND